MIKRILALLAVALLSLGVPAYAQVSTSYGVVTTTSNGVAPASPGGTTAFLRADGTWATPPGSTVTWPTSGYAVISNGTNTPTGVAPVNNDCLAGSGGAWTAVPCFSTGYRVSTSTTLATTDFQVFASYTVTAASVTLTIPQTTTLTSPTNGGVIVLAEGGAVTLQANASDSINGGSTGGTYTVASGTTATVTTDGAGHLYATGGASGGGGSGTVNNCGTAGNVAYYSATGTAVSCEALSALIDSAIGNVQGDILYRGASTWSVLAPGTSGNCLQTGGAAANPSWGACGSGGGSPGGSTTQVQYNNAGAFGGVSGATVSGAVMTFAANDIVVSTVVAPASTDMTFSPPSGSINLNPSGGNSIRFRQASTTVFSLASPYFSAANSSGPQFVNQATGSAPDINPNEADANAGLGASSSGCTTSYADVSSAAVNRFDVCPLGLYEKGATPTVGGTATPTITTGSSDSAGQVIAGTSATSVTITFASAKTNAPFCIVQPQTQLVAFSYTVSTTAITITQTATTGDTINYICRQR